MSEPTATLFGILDAVTAQFGVSRIDLESARRDRRTAYARQCFCLLARELTDRSFNQIARQIGGRDHTTVRFGVEAARRRVECDKAYAEHYRAIMRKFGRLV